MQSSGMGEGFIGKKRWLIGKNQSFGKLPFFLKSLGSVLLILRKVLLKC